MHELDEATGASLKLSILNPKGRVWTMVRVAGCRACLGRVQELIIQEFRKGVRPSLQQIVASPRAAIRSLWCMTCAGATLQGLG